MTNIVTLFESIIYFHGIPVAEKDSPRPNRAKSTKVIAKTLITLRAICSRESERISEMLLSTSIYT